MRLIIALSTFVALASARDLRAGKRNLQVDFAGAAAESFDYEEKQIFFQQQQDERELQSCQCYGSPSQPTSSPIGTASASTPSPVAATTIGDLDDHCEEKNGKSKGGKGGYDNEGNLCGAAEPLEFSSLEFGLTAGADTACVAMALTTGHGKQGGKYGGKKGGGRTRRGLSNPFERKLSKKDCDEYDEEEDCGKAKGCDFEQVCENDQLSALAACSVCCNKYCETGTVAEPVEPVDEAECEDGDGKAKSKGYVQSSTGECMTVGMTSDECDGKAGKGNDGQMDGCSPLMLQQDLICSEADCECYQDPGPVDEPPTDPDPVGPVSETDACEPYIQVCTCDGSINVDYDICGLPTTDCDRISIYAYDPQEQYKYFPTQFYHACNGGASQCNTTLGELAPQTQMMEFSVAAEIHSYNTNLDSTTFDCYPEGDYVIFYERCTGASPPPYDKVLESEVFTWSVTPDPLCPVQSN